MKLKRISASIATRFCWNSDTPSIVAWSLTLSLTPPIVANEDVLKSPTTAPSLRELVVTSLRPRKLVPTPSENDGRYSGLPLLSTVDRIWPSNSGDTTTESVL